MFVPKWVTLTVAACVALFGLYRIYLAFTTPPEALKRRRGLYGLPRRTHVLFGVLYLLLASFLVAGVFGYRLFRFG